MRFHLAVEFAEDGTSKVLYAGQEVLLAEKAVADSVTRAEAVRVDRFFNPVPVSIRHPKAEKESSDNRAKAAKDGKVAAVQARMAEAKAKRDQAKDLLNQAKILEAGAVPAPQAQPPAAGSKKV